MVVVVSDGFSLSSTMVLGVLVDLVVYAVVLAGENNVRNHKGILCPFVFFCFFFFISWR